MDGEAGWLTTSGKFGLPPLARIMGVGRQQHQHHHIAVTSPVHLQDDHEEADTLIAFYVANNTADNVMVRASDTEVLIILIGTLGQQWREDRTMANIIMDCGIGSSRRYIILTKIAEVHEEHKHGLGKSLPRYHRMRLRIRILQVGTNSISVKYHY